MDELTRLRRENYHLWRSLEAVADVSMKQIQDLGRVTAVGQVLVAKEGLHRADTAQPIDEDDGLTYEQKWRRRGFEVEWSDDHRMYEVRYQGKDPVNRFRTVQEVDDFVTAGEKEAKAAGKPLELPEDWEGDSSTCAVCGNSSRGDRKFIPEEIWCCDVCGEFAHRAGELIPRDPPPRHGPLSVVLARAMYHEKYPG